MFWFIFAVVCLYASFVQGRQLTRIEKQVTDIAKTFGAVLLLGFTAFAQDLPSPNQMHLSVTTRSYFRNPDGSCVQCSIGMAGAHCNDPNAATLLWDTEYGPAERGGSWPSRVEKYCDKRGIQPIPSLALRSTIRCLGFNGRRKQGASRQLALERLIFRRSTVTIRRRMNT